MKTIARAHLSLTFFAILATLGVLCLYASAAHSLPTSLSKMYLVSVAGYFAGCVFAVNLALLPTRLSKYTSWLAPCLLWVWLLYLLANYGVFHLYKHHVSLLLFKAYITTPDDIGVPIFLQIAAALLAGLLGVIIYYINRLTYRTTHRQYWVMVGILTLIIPTFAFNSVTHIWASHYSREEITTIDSLFPLYHPVTSHKNAPKISAAFPSIYPPIAGQQSEFASGDKDAIIYPIEPIHCEPLSAPPSILFVVLESWQQDSVRPEIMPNLCSFAECATQFDQHLSGGASTVPGLFSLMFGLHPSYHDRFKGAMQTNPSVFTETLHKQGYRSRVYTTTNLDRFSLRPLFFSRTKEEDLFRGKNDQEVIDKYLATFNEPQDKQTPRFDFLFLTSSHSPYVYPKEFSRFQPLPLVEGGFALYSSADAKPYKNDYHNSLYYTDSLMKLIFDKLKSEGRMENTWVVVTGDHAEEFNENGQGYWGHGSNFSRWQTHVPMVVHAPGQTTKAVESKLSLHQDVVPTLMAEALGCRSPMEHYSNGAHLLKLPQERGTVLSSYFTKAYFIDGVILENSTGDSYRWNNMKESESSPNMAELKQVMAEEQHFLR
ncbi:MAG: sulfatase-like hydrolase/transferase [Planctomycetaceae bacterium]